MNGMPQAHDVAALSIAAMAKDSASIVETIATGLCLAFDRGVQGRLRELGGIPGTGPFLVKRGRLYFEIVGPKVKVHRRSIRDLLAVDLDAVLQSDVAFARQLWDATTRSVHLEKAGRIVLPFVSAGSFPDPQALSRHPTVDTGGRTAVISDRDSGGRTLGYRPSSRAGLVAIRALIS
jgi:hypothetical protein